MTLLPICISLWMLSSCLRQPDKAALQAELHDAQEADAGHRGRVHPGMSVVKVFNRDPQRLPPVRGRPESLHRCGGADGTGQRQAHGRLLCLGGAAFFSCFRRPCCSSPAEAALWISCPSFCCLSGGRRIEGAAGKHDADGDLSRVSWRASAAWTTSSVSRSRIRRNRKSNCLRCGIFQCGVCLYQGIPVVDHVSFRLPQGTVTGLVGPSRRREVHSRPASSAFYEPQAGSIRIGGVDIGTSHRTGWPTWWPIMCSGLQNVHRHRENNIRMGNTAATMAEVERKRQRT